MADLGQTLDYRSWLKDLYEERKAQDAFFSWRYLAGRLGVDASYLVRVAQGHRHLSEDALEKLAAFANLRGKDLEIFRALTAFNRARGSREQQECFRKLQELRSPGIAVLPDDHVEFFRRWFPVVVRTLGGLTGFVDDPKWVGRRLDPAIPEDEAAQALELVKRLGLLRQDATGKWTLGDPFLSSPPGMDPKVMRAFQKQMIDLAGESLERHPPELRDITTLTLALDLEDLPEARERLRTLRESLLRLSGENPSPRQVYQLNLQLFPLTRIPEGARQARPVRRKVLGCLAALLGSFALAACGSSATDVAGGSGIETGNYLTVRATDAAGHALAGAVVRRLATTDWAARVRTGATPVLDSAVCDSTGTVRIPAGPGGTDDRLEVQSDSLMGWMSVGGKKDVAVRLGRTSVGTFLFDSLASERVWVNRTSLQTLVSGGTARLCVPEGLPVLLTGTGAGEVRVVGNVDGAKDSVRLRWEPDRFLLDDFEAAPVRILPGLLTEGGAWFFTTDSAQGGRSRFLPEGVTDNRSLALVAGDSAWSGRSLRLGFSVVQGLPANSLTVGFLFGRDSSDARDLSCLDSVVFRAKGSGNVFLEPRLLPGDGDYRNGISFLPGATWIRYSLPATAFWSGRTTSDLLSRLVGLEFRVAASGELWLDELELKGCRVGQVYPELGR